MSGKTTAAEPQTYCYVGIEPCGCCTAITVDDREHPETVQEDIREYESSGRTVKRMPLKEGQELFTKGFDCKHDNTSPNTDHVVMGGKGILCTRCGKTEALPLPLKVDAFIRWTRDWAKEHVGCKEN